MNKRFFDLFSALFVLLVTIPIMAVVALLVQRYMGSPILFSQRRPGLGGHPFLLYKFRTMTEARDNDGELLPDDARLSKLGLFLRRSSLDELPQLFNVIKGDLSLVGPRPLLMEYLSLYTKEQARRHEVTPGITGWAQVNGRNAISWEQKFALDVWYVDHQSFWLDMKILALTVKKVLIKEGISAQGVETMPKFTGRKAVNKK
jgi:sugar transferase EpsL